MPRPPEHRSRVLVVGASDVERSTLEAAVEALELPAEIEALVSSDELGRGAQRSDCVVVFPGASPERAVTKLRAEPRPILVVVVTAPDERLEAELLEAGATEVLATSDLSPGRLARRLALLVRLARAESQARSATAALEDATSARDEFVSLVSHELRGDLSTIGLACDVLLSTLDGAEGTAYVKTIERAIGRASATLDMLHDMIIIEKRGLELDMAVLDARSILERAHRDNAERAQRLGSELIVRAPNEPVEVALDRVRVTQAVSDLTRRAVAYAGGRDVEMGIEDRGDAVVLSVGSEGFYVEPEQVNRAFARSWRGPRGDGSLELGAAVSRAIAEHHGGWVRVVGDSETGSRFELAIPRSKT